MRLDWWGVWTGGEALGTSLSLWSCCCFVELSRSVYIKLTFDKKARLLHALGRPERTALRSVPLPCWQTGPASAPDPSSVGSVDARPPPLSSAPHPRPLRRVPAMPLPAMPRPHARRSALTGAPRRKQRPKRDPPTRRASRSAPPPVAATKTAASTPPTRRFAEGTVSSPVRPDEHTARAPRSRPCHRTDGPPPPLPSPPSPSTPLNCRLRTSRRAPRRP